MTEHPFTAQDLEALKAWDRPTICNGLEIVSPERRAIGFTIEPVVVVDRKLPPIVGLARTGMIRAKEPPRGPIPPREDWYDYVAAGAMPTIAIALDGSEFDEGSILIVTLVVLPSAAWRLAGALRHAAGPDREVRSRARCCPGR